MREDGQDRGPEIDTQKEIMFKVRADWRGGVFVTTDRDAAERFAQAKGSEILTLPLLTPPR